MSDSAGRGDGQTAHPDTRAAGLRRRTVPRTAGASARDLLDGSGVAAGLGLPLDDEDEDDIRGENDHRVGPPWDDPEDYPDVLAHRGFAGAYPENTIGAVEAAWGGGRGGDSCAGDPDGIEIDVVPTADDDVVVFHDDRLGSRGGGERGLTDAEGLVWEQPTDTVTKAEVLDSGETVPLLSDVLTALPRHVQVDVELKNPGSTELRFAASLSESALTTQKEIWRPFVERVLDVVDDADNDVFFSSFYEAALATTREASEYPVAPLLWDSVETGLAIADRYDAEAIHPPYTMIRGTPFYRDEHHGEGAGVTDVSIVESAREAGRDVNVYTIGTWYQAERLAAAGVDGLIADYPGLSWTDGRGR